MCTMDLRKVQICLQFSNKFGKNIPGIINLINYLCDLVNMYTSQHNTIGILTHYKLVGLVMNNVNTHTHMHTQMETHDYYSLCKMTII